MRRKERRTNLGAGKRKKKKKGGGEERGGKMKNLPTNLLENLGHLKKRRTGVQKGKLTRKRPREKSERIIQKRRPGAGFFEKGKPYLFHGIEDSATEKKGKKKEMGRRVQFRRNREEEENAEPGVDEERNKKEKCRATSQKRKKKKKRKETIIKNTS